MEGKGDLDGKYGKRSSSFECEINDEKRKKSTTSLMNELLLQEKFIEEMGSIYKLGKSYYTDNGLCQVIAEPYHCCVINNFIRDEELLDQLKSDVLSLEFHEKSNDLYKFEQSDDLKSSCSFAIQSIRNALYIDFLSWLRRVTGLELNDTMDLSCAKYSYTDTLLCHDDELEGRRIAFIFYLVPPWDEKDGGTLDLFSVDDDGHPDEVVKSLTPKWNTLIFFEVTPKSFHQVSEVLNKDKCRLSISGWFHGETLPRPICKPEPKRIAESYRREKDDILLEWINPMYLNPEIVDSIQEQLEENSEIQLDEFLLEEKYNDIVKELRCSSTLWTRKGPANKRKYETLADQAVIPPNLKSLMDLMKSQPMFKLLTKLTGLKLAELEGGNESQDSALSSSSNDKVADSVELDSCYTCEVRHWSHGCYTLMHDSDPGSHEFALDAMLFFDSDDWDTSAGGFTTYVASGEDEELLTVCPTSNCLALVYRDKETVRFVKHINASYKDMLLKSDKDSEISQGFYDMSLVYFE